MPNTPEDESADFAKAVKSGLSASVTESYARISNLEKEIELQTELINLVELYGKSAKGVSISQISSLSRALSAVQKINGTYKEGSKHIVKNADDMKKFGNAIKSSLRVANQLVDTHKKSVELKKSEIKEQIKLSKLDVDRVKTESKLADLKQKEAKSRAYKPSSEMLKTAMNQADINKEWNRAHPGSAQLSEKVGKGAMGAEAATVIGRGAMGIATGGMSGLGGAGAGIASMVGGMAGAVGGMAGPIGAMIGGAVGPILQAGVTAGMILIEQDIKRNIFNAAINRMSNFASGLTAAGDVGVVQGNLSMSEVEGIQKAGAGMGMAFTKEGGNLDAANEFNQLAMAMKLYGDGAAGTIRDLSFATGDYKKSLSLVNNVMASSIDGAKNLSISQDEVAKQMSNAGLQARLAGTDAMEAMQLYNKVAASDTTRDTLKGFGIDVSKEGGTIVGGLAGIGGKLGMAQQAYLSGDSNPLMGAYKMTYGDKNKMSIDPITKLITSKMGEGKDFYAAGKIQEDLKSKMSEFRKGSSSDEEAFMKTQMYAKGALGLDKKDVETLLSVNLGTNEGLKKAADAINKPTDVLSALQSMNSKNQNISTAIATIVSGWVPMKSILEAISGKGSSGEANALGAMNKEYEKGNYLTANKIAREKLTSPTSSMAERFEAGNAAIRTGFLSIFAQDKQGKPLTSEEKSKINVTPYKPFDQNQLLKPPTKEEKSNMPSLSSYEKTPSGYFFTSNVQTKVFVPNSAVDQFKRT